MKQKLIGLSQRYVTALRTHLNQGPRANLRSALDLGRRAVVLGLETLDLARIHERALDRLKLSKSNNRLLARAQGFFTAASLPIEQTHHAARRNKIHLTRLKAALGERTKELAVSHRQVRQGAVRRKLMQADFEKSGTRHDKSLKESLQLQDRLRELTHQVLAAQEEERKKISHELQNEIAQTLLGINVRLLSLKRGNRNNTNGLKNEIASAQRLVLNSARSVQRFARELGSHHKTRRDPATIL